MKARFDMGKAAPQLYKAMGALEQAQAGGRLSKTHKELIKIRASQINGCGFCLNMHSKDTLKNGEAAQRIFVLSAWRETNLFSEEERVILAMTEEITVLGQHGLSEETYQQAVRLFDEEQIAQIIMAVVIINAWNRIAISTGASADVAPES